MDFLWVFLDCCCYHIQMIYNFIKFARNSHLIVVFNINIIELNWCFGNIFHLLSLTSWNVQNTLRICRSLMVFVLWRPLLQNKQKEKILEYLEKIDNKRENLVWHFQSNINFKNLLEYLISPLSNIGE